MTATDSPFPDRAERALLLLSIGSALAWALGSGGDGGSALLAAKAATVGALALVALRRRRELAGGTLLGFALAAHAAGDLLIEVVLLAGVAAFFVGHLGYLRLFWRSRRPIHEIGGGTKLALGILALAAAGFVVALAPRLAGFERVAIPLYVAALISMAGGALISRRGSPWVALGALSFVASDALLSLELFGRGAGRGARLVWPLYVVGQLAIACGWLGRADPPQRIS